MRESEREVSERVSQREREREREREKARAREGERARERARESEQESARESARLREKRDREQGVTPPTHTPSPGPLASSCLTPLLYTPTRIHAHTTGGGRE